MQGFEYEFHGSGLPSEVFIRYGKAASNCHVLIDGSPISCPCSHYIHYDSMEGFYKSDTIRTGTHAICNEGSIRMPFRGALKVTWAEKSDDAVVLWIDIEGYRNDGVSVIVLVSIGHIQ